LLNRFNKSTFAHLPLLFMKCIVFIFLWLYITFPAIAQEEDAIVGIKGKQYLNSNIKRLSVYNRKTDELQSRLLVRLKKHEDRFARHLKKSDSAAYVRFQQQPISFDSIANIEKKNLPASSLKLPRIDSLNAINKFISGKAPTNQNAEKATSEFGDQLKEQKNKLAGNQQVNGLIEQRLAFLKSLNTNPKTKLKGLGGMDKQVFYAKSKIQALKEISEDPSKVEEQALEYLQGEEGFDKLLQNASGNNSNALAGKSVDELERMGYQTKRQMTAQLQGKLGSGLSTVQQNMAAQVKDYSDKLKDVKSIQTTIKQTKQSATQFKNTEKPAFKVNLMRGKPFMQRIEKQFNWQANRAALDGKPATLQLSGMAGFRHTPKLSYGLGLALITGLGQNWNHVKISFEGLGLRSYAAWQWQYGIGAYVGYERTYKQAAFITSQGEIISSEYNNHNKSAYNDAVLVGLTKSYKLNDKLNGSIQVLYDIWWKEKGLKTPIQLRIATTKN
jgi:hypothetical protein